MFSKADAKAWNQRFYTNFGTYMLKHVPQADPGLRASLKWLNYRTGVKDIYFRLEADKNKAIVAIDLQHPDEGVRELFFEQFQEFKGILESIAGPLIWDENYTLENGRQVSRIYQQLGGVNYYKEDDWHTIFPFFEKYLLAFDEFWADFKEVFVQLAN